MDTRIRILKIICVTLSTALLVALPAQARRDAMMQLGANIQATEYSLSICEAEKARSAKSVEKCQGEVKTLEEEIKKIETSDKIPEIEKLETQVSEVQRQVDALQHEVHVRERSQRRMLNEERDLEAQLKDLEAQYAYSSQQQKECEEEVKHLIAELQSSMNHSSTANETSRLEQALRTRQKSIHGLQADIDKTSDEIKEDFEESVSLYKSDKEFEDELETSKYDITQLSDENKMARKGIQRCQNATAEMAKVHNESVAEINRLESLALQQGRRISKLISTMDMKGKRIDRLRRKFSDLQYFKDEIQSYLDKCMKNKAICDDENKKLRWDEAYLKEREAHPNA